MTPKKPGEKADRASPPAIPDGKALAAGERPADPADNPSQAAETSKRKPWKPKTPVEVVLEQIHKQEEKVAAMEQELTKEKNELQKLLKAKAVLEGK